MTAVGNQPLTKPTPPPVTPAAKPGVTVQAEVVQAEPKPLIDVLACLASTAQSVQFHGQGGARVSIDIPESHIEQAREFTKLRGIPLRVVVYPGA